MIKEIENFCHKVVNLMSAGHATVYKKFFRQFGNLYYGKCNCEPH